MSLDDRGRRAAHELRMSVRTLPSRDGAVVQRFHLERQRRTRNQRIATAVVAIAIAVVGFALVAPMLRGERTVPATPSSSGSILFGRWIPRLQQAEWFTIGTDGSGLHDLGVVATCARWWPDGSKILITDDADVGPGHPLRPATVNPDGTGRRPLDAADDPTLNLGCGWVSPDGSTIALEGFDDRRVGSNGIYTVRASNGGGLTRLTHSPPGGNDADPAYSPDGSRIVFFRTKPGVSPQGAGAIFVMNADGSGLRRITPWGGAFNGQTWSPAGSWIAYQRPYGVLSLVRPDGTDLHDLPVPLPPGSGAANPSWSPDGRWIAFSLAAGGDANIYIVHPDGRGLTQVTKATGVDEQTPYWTTGAEP